MELGKNLTKALLSVQQTLDGVAKSGQNPHLKSKYATLPDVLDELLPKCHEAGLVVLQRTLDTETTGVLKLETIVIHAESGENLSMVTPMPVPQTGAQAYGSALTYARRYALMSLFGMKAEDDDGHSATATTRAENGVRNGMPNERAGAYSQNYQASNGRGNDGYGRNGTVPRDHGRVRDAYPDEERFVEEPPRNLPASPAPVSSGFEAEPTDRQRDMLRQLGYDGDPPRTRAEASQIISRLKAQRATVN
ncbi:MAG: ERF family protein [Capsulimonadales bacterium]|nr:ERF family protein [Capsulimonadales bacterium]